MIKNKIRDKEGRFIKGHFVPESFKEKIRNCKYKIPEKLLKEKGIKEECQICRDKEKRLHIHHISGDRNNNHHTNLSVVCSYCHSAIHRIGVRTRFKIGHIPTDEWKKNHSEFMKQLWKNPSFRLKRANIYLK